MPIYVTDETGTAKKIGQVTIGSKSIPKVYWGDSLVFEGLQVYTLPTTENINLADYLVTQGANTASDVIMNLPVGNTLYSNSIDLPAVETGDLSIYTKGVTLNIYGEIQGAPGGDAFNSTANITIYNEGAIRAGGGNGGDGGTGGYGDNIINKEGPYYAPAGGLPLGSQYQYVWWYGTTVATVYPSAWAGTNVFTNDTSGGGSTIRYRKVGNKWYYPGLSPVAAQYEIGRGDAIEGVKGTGGVGGQGQGDGVARTDGTAGTNGTNKAGSGGDGGTGGAWGVDGLSGEDGGTGTYITQTGIRSASGTAGTAGTPAGKAIVSNASFVTLLGTGVVNGDVQ